MTTDLLIVGAGIAGLALAEAVSADDPDARILIVEAASEPAGASRYAGAIDIPIAESALQRSLIDANSAWWSGFIARSPDAVDLRRTVRLEWSAQRATANALLDCTYPTGQFSIRTRKRSDASTLVGECAIIDAQGLLQLLWERAKQRNQVMTDSEVLTVNSDEDHVTVATRDGQVLTARHVVVAVGPWLPSVIDRNPTLRPVGAVRSKRVVGFRFEAPGLPRDRAFADLDRGIFVFPRAEGHAASVKHDEWDVTPAESVAPETAAESLRAYVAELGGSISDIAPFVFADAYTMAEDPLIGRTPESERVFHLGAFQGSGMRLAPGAGHALAKHLHALHPRKVAH